MKIRIAGATYPLLATIVTLALVVALVLLGNWQIKRKYEKEQLISSVEENIEGAPTYVEDDAPDVGMFAKIAIQGSFTNDDIFLYGRRSGAPEKDGYYILSSFKQKDTNNIFLVSRGWAPASFKSDVENDRVVMHSEDELIVGITMPSEPSRMFTPKNDLEKNIWFNIDLEQASETIGVNVKQFYVLQVEAEGLPIAVMPHKVDRLSRIRNDHMEYALTWYSLAGALTVFYLFFFRKKTRKRSGFRRVLAKEE